MVAARSARFIIGVKYEDVINSIDWNRVLFQSMGEHAREHPIDAAPTCGTCLKNVLLRQDE